MYRKKEYDIGDGLQWHKVHTQFQENKSGSTVSLGWKDQTMPPPPPPPTTKKKKNTTTNPPPSKKKKKHPTNNI